MLVAQVEVLILHLPLLSLPLVFRFTHSIQMLSPFSSYIFGAVDTTGHRLVISLSSFFITRTYIETGEVVYNGDIFILSSQLCASPLVTSFSPISSL